MRPVIDQTVSILKDSVKGLPVVGPLARRVYRHFSTRELVEFPGSGSYWENRYAQEGDSGVGSYGKFASFKAETINAFVASRSVRSVIEFGCGDGNQLRLARYPSYIGFDVSKTAVERCSKLFADDPGKTFRLASAYERDKADLVLSLDVIFHLVEDDVFEKYMENLFAASTRYVIIYSSDFDQDTDKDGVHVKHRKFSDWVLRHCRSWNLLERIPNKYPYNGNYQEGSFADFFIYEKRG